MPDQVSFAKGSTKPTSGITTGRLYVVDSSTTDKSDLYLGKDATHLIQIGATVAQGAKADSSVQSVKVGSTSYSPSSGVVSLPAYPTTLPASDVYAWAKAATKPSYNLDEVPDGTNRKLSRYVPYNGVLMPTNPFGGKMLYINSIDNAFASAPKRYYVTGTVHLKTVNGVNYPYEDTSKAITDDNYWVDSSVVSTLTSAQCQSLFDGSYEGGYTIPVGHYLKLRIMFGTNTSPSGSTSYFPGYPYGSYYLSYYHTGVPSSTEAHIYNKYAAHTVGWHKYQATYFVGSSSSTSSVIQQISDGGDYQRTCVDFIIKSPDSGTATTITEVDYQLSRPALSRDGSTVTKFGNQVLYHLFLWNNGTENGGTNTVQIDPNGTITAISFKENGTDLSSKYLALTGGTMTGRLTVKSPIFGYVYNASNNKAAFILDKPGSNASGIGAHAETDVIYFGACSVDGDWVDSYKQKWKFNGTIIEDSTALADKYAAKSHTHYWANQQVSDSSSVVSTPTFGKITVAGVNGTSNIAARLEIKGVVNSVDSSCIRVNSSNSTKRTLYVQPDIQAGSASGTAGVIIGGTIDSTPDTTYKLKVVGSANATTLYENGTALSSKYGQLSAANTWTGVNTFTASDFYVTASNDVSISGNSGQNIISTDNGTDVLVGDSTTDTTYIYGNVVDLNSSAVNIGSSSSGTVSINGATTVTGSISWASDPSSNNQLTRKSYVDNKFVDKTSNQTSIAGTKTWTGLSNFTSGLSASKSESNKAEVHFSADSERIDFSVYDNNYIYSDEDTGVYASFYYYGVNTNKKPGFDIYTQSYYSMYYAGVISTNGESATLYYEDSDLFNNSSVQVKGRDIILTSDHEGTGAVSTTFHNDGGIMYLGDPNIGWVSINDIISQITCFRGDTTYVTMYDGTKKLISEVKEGDSVLGYDVNKKDYCEAIVIKNIKTGEQMGYNCYVMDDGTTIDIHGDDNFIANVKDKWYCDSDGDYLGIYSMTKNLMKFHDTGDDSHRIIKETGNLDNTTCVIHTFWTPCAEMTPRYSLYTSNGTMFVNGLLHAQSPRDTINIFRKRKFTLPDNIKEIFDEISVDMSARDEALPNDRISNPEKAENIAKLNEAKVKIAVYKKKLADTDYKAMKYAEGALTEEEWLPVKEDRASWRDTVNQMEDIVAEYQPIVEEENPEMFEHDWQYKNSKWKYRQSIFDAHLEDFREWQESVKEERQKRIEESKERSRLRSEEIKANKSSQKNEDK